MAEKNYPVTPDGRYFVVRSRLWRCSNPALSPAERSNLVDKLMQARRRKGQARRAGDRVAQESTRQQVDHIKRQLGERGPVWWTDGSPDWNRYLVKNTPYADWWLHLERSHGMESSDRQ
jgi:hypothetical protein